MYGTEEIWMQHCIGVEKKRRASSQKEHKKG
jgi:hypothetical protein